MPKRIAGNKHHEAIVVLQKRIEKAKDIIDVESSLDTVFSRAEVVNQKKYIIKINNSIDVLLKSN